MSLRPSLHTADLDVESFIDELSPADGYFNHRSRIPQHVPVTILRQSSAAADEDLDALYNSHGGDDDGERSRMRAVGGSNSVNYLGVDGTARTIETEQWQSPTSCTARPPSTGPFLPGKQSEQYSEHSLLLLSAPSAYSTATGNSSYLSWDNSGALDESRNGGGYGSTVAGAVRGVPSVP